MSTGSTPTSAMSPLLHRLIDDAGLFPPASLPMTTALDKHLQHRAGPFSAMLGRFLCPASRLAELIAALDRSLSRADDIVLGLILDTGADTLPTTLDLLRTEPRLRLDVIEVPLPPTATDLAAAAHTTVDALVDALPEIEGYVELPRRGEWESALQVIAESPYGAKLRTGGTTADAFPSEAEVAAFIQACETANLSFKCTAGLHHAVRHTDPATGFEHHGFLNVLLATSTAAQGVDLAAVVHVLGERDPHVLAGRFAALEVSDRVSAQSLFTAFGSCSFEEPIEDLIALGLLEKE